MSLTKTDPQTTLLIVFGRLVSVGSAAGMCLNSNRHWEVLRSLLPLYQAITSVQIGDGATCSFWKDVWFGEDALEDTCPALFSHCTRQDATVRRVFESGIQANLVPRLSTRASQELLRVAGIIAQVTLTSAPDYRTSLLSVKGDADLDSMSIYRLLKARGQPNKGLLHLE